MLSENLRLARSELLKSLADGQIRLAFQPQIELTTGRVVAFEGVARWFHEGLGELQPGLFLGLAAREGVLGVLSRTLLADAARAACEFRLAGHEVDIALNLSTSDLTDPSFSQDAIAIIARSGARADWIVLEAPEEGLAFAGHTGFAGLERLKCAGFKLALDAKGPPSVALDKQARTLFDQLKCGGATMLRVASLLHERGASAFMRRLDAARAAELPVVAVGAESDEVVKLFTELGFSRLQGLAIAGPMSLDSCLWMLGQAGSHDDGILADMEPVNHSIEASDDQSAPDLILPVPRQAKSARLLETQVPGPEPIARSAALTLFSLDVDDTEEADDDKTLFGEGVQLQHAG
jgi:EAL domain-containing protein (putative c-di-GMP-specific phosphodiesterase class I)